MIGDLVRYEASERSLNALRLFAKGVRYGKYLLGEYQMSKAICRTEVSQ